jgi:hypothetical protein
VLWVIITHDWISHQGFVGESSSTQRQQFLSFTTSVPIVTLGKIEAVPMVSSMCKFLSMRDPGCLPLANSCA